ncbi:MAG TPA: hypothetical protein VM285_14295 [Polyangia bacterium]|nr:hypothetical protein [Polyangia bacterium]
MASLSGRLRAASWNRETAFLLGLALIALVAFAIRLFWVLEVQPPGEAVFSDMRSYIHRAVWLVLRQQEISDSRALDAALFPYGVHYFYALQLVLSGLASPEIGEQMRYHYAGTDLTALAVVQAVANALVVIFSMLAARRCMRSPWGPIATGVLVAVWHPLVSYAGFFSSETPYACMVSLSFWLWLRYAQTGKGALGAGLATAAGFTMRPQLLLTAVLGIAWLLYRRKRLAHFRVAQLAWLAAPLLLVVAFSAWRFHSFTGEWGLISGNAAIGRFFAATDYASIAADDRRTFQPPARSTSNGFEGVFEFEGFISDAAPLEAERERIWSARTTLEKLGTLRRNVLLLFRDNRLWPERNAAKYAAAFAAAGERMRLERADTDRREIQRRAREVERSVAREAGEASAWRQGLLTVFEPVVFWGLVPLACIGLLVVVRRFNPGLEIAALHVGTMVYSAAAYFGEARYRVPYDPLLILLAVAGILTLIRIEGSTEPQDRVTAIAAGAALVSLVAFLAVPW